MGSSRDFSHGEKIRSGKQEKPFHEIILQIGDKDTMGAETEKGLLAAKVLDFEKQERAKEVEKLEVKRAELQSEAERCQKRLSELAPMVKNMERLAAEFSADPEQTLPQTARMETARMETARSYREKKAKPLVEKLVLDNM